MGYGRRCLRIARMMALVLAAVGALSLPHLGPGASQAGVAQAQIPPREAPQISALIQATTSSIAVVWLPADATDLHWLYAVKADGTGARFLPAVPDPPQGASGQGGVSGVSHVTTVRGLDAGTTYWLAVLGIRAPSDSSPSTWFRWSNWGTGTTRTVSTVSLGTDLTVAEGATATFTVTASPAPQSPLTVNYAIDADDDAATVDGDSADYSGTATGSLTIATGATEGSIAIAITDDRAIDDGAQEILVVTISLPPGSSYQLGANASATVTITEGVCDRTAAVRTAMLDALTGISACAAVTDADLSGITGTLDLSSESLTAVQARDFHGLTGLQVLRLNHNALGSLPADVFDGLTSLQELYLNHNASLAALPANVFNGLTSLTTLSLSNTALAALEADVFDGLTSLATLRLNNNASLATLPAEVFDGLSSLTTLRLNNNALTALPDGVFDGLTGLEGLYLAGNPGSAFTLTAAVEQTVATEVTVAVAQAAPFATSLTLSVQGGTLADTSVVIPAGSRASSAITVTPSGDTPVTVRVTAASFPASGVAIDGVTVTYNGLQTGLGAANQAPTADAGLDQPADTGATVTLDASGSNDPDTSDTLSYRWAQTAGALVTLSSPTAASPTFTAPSSAATLTFQVTVMDGRGGSDRDAVAITVSGNAPPRFTSEAMFSLAENTAAVDTVTADDPDTGDSITGYTLSGTDAALFAITSAGALTFSAAPDFEDPQGGVDDDANSYTLTVTGTGGASGRALTATQALTVTVTDVNEAPTFRSIEPFSVAENTTAVGTVAATDPDAGDSVTYALSGTDAALFQITTAGALSFSAAPDFEAPQGGVDDDANSYALTVTATGGTGGRALTATQALTVTVTDVNEPLTAAVSGSPATHDGQTAFTFQLRFSENVDIGFSTLRDDTFDVTGGTVTGASRLVPGSNQGWDITLEPAAHADVTVVLPVTTDCAATGAVCTAGGKMLSAQVEFAVTDVNDPPTITSSDSFSVAENTTTVDTVTATDADVADSVTGYSLSGTDAVLFQITTAGALSFSSAPNFEAPRGGPSDNSNTYELTVTATGGTGARSRTDTQALTVTVTDVNEAPTITSSPTFSVAENLTAVGPVTAADPDAADSVTFALSGTDAGLFEITTAGALAFSAAPDFEAPEGGSTDDSNSYTFTVTATGGTGGREVAATQNLTVTVTDANEAPTVTSTTFRLAENRTTVGTVRATDPDTADSITGYSLSGTDAALFQITSGGALSFRSAPNFENPQGGAIDDSNSYTLTVTATGGTGGRALTATQALTVNVTDANDPPTITSEGIFPVAENTTPVGTVTATDSDSADSITGYTLSGTDASLFAITSAGVLTFSTAPDFEEPEGGADDDSNSYALTVTATGGTGGRALTATQNLTVTVTDAIDKPGAVTNLRVTKLSNTQNRYRLTWDLPTNDGGSPLTSIWVAWTAFTQEDATGHGIQTGGHSVEASTTSETLDLPDDDEWPGGYLDRSYSFRVTSRNSVGSGLTTTLIFNG